MRQRRVDGRTTRAEKRRSERRQQILRCARKLFGHRGYHLTSVADIIDEAKVARGTFYLHFPSKRAIFDELIEDLFLRLFQRVRRIELDPGAPPPVDQMRANVLGVVTLLLEERDLSRLLLREAGVDAEFDRKLQVFYDRLMSRIEHGIVLGQQMDLVRPCDTRVTSACVLGSLKEVMYRYAVAGETPPSPDVLAQHVLDYIVSALFRPVQKLS